MSTNASDAFQTPLDASQTLQDASQTSPRRSQTPPDIPKLPGISWSLPASPGTFRSLGFVVYWAS